MIAPSGMVPLFDWSDVFSFQDYGDLVALLANSIIAGAVLHRRGTDRRLRHAA